MTCRVAVSSFGLRPILNSHKSKRLDVICDPAVSGRLGQGEASV